MIEKIFILVAVTTIILSCGKPQKQVTKPTPKKSSQQIEISTAAIVSSIARYVYDGSSYRDPFTPLSGEKLAKAKLGSSADAVIPSLGSLQLKAFIVDKEDKIAMFTSPYGSYLLVNGKLYDNQNRLVKGFAGKVIFDMSLGKPKSVILFNPSNESKQYFLSE
ncbi:MAG: hypothetical protein NZ928_03770 [Endomicrobia bacterium]|nr:hypothetical protein [Endomicrobiia bacterium]MCX7941333.1 hypothetical protein [Endomicrobiia bacterium]MDW8055979.1 hypothetical protein [Elusimicrobiota bacterium]